MNCIDCNKTPIIARGYCRTCYHRHRQKGDLSNSPTKKLTLEARFMRFFERAIKTENGCLEWPGQKHGGKFNYGIITLEVPGQKHSKLFRAHRISHEIFKGPIPNGFDVMHSCDNPSCVNPKHLSAGTRKENLVDMAKKGRMFNPAQKLTLEQVNFIKSSDLTQNELAKQFSVMQSTISRIKNGKRWKYPHQNKNKKE